MSFIRRTRSALRAMSSEQRYFEDARIVDQGNDTFSIETFWRNPEIAGTWLFRHTLHRDCFYAMYNRALISPAEKTESGEQSYRLTRPE